MISKNEAKFINSLKIKKYRHIERRFLVEGLKNVLELLQSDWVVDSLYCTQELLDQLKNYNPKVLTTKELNSLSTLATNESCFAVVKFHETELPKTPLTSHAIVLDGIKDPGNLGTIIRSMDWFGFRHLICSLDCADFYNPKTIAATMGSFSRIIPIYTNIETLLPNLNRKIFGMQMHGSPLSQIKVAEPAVFVMGSESHGISNSIAQLITQSITIPAYGNAESLNVAMATTLLLYQLRS